MTVPENPRPRRRRYSLWTLLAPVALIVTVMLLANAIGRSGVFDDSKQTSSKTTKAGAGNTKPGSSTTPARTSTTGCTPPTGRKQVRVKASQTLSVIADANCTTVEKLLELNPAITDPQSLQLDQRIVVSRPTAGAARQDGSAGGDGSASDGQ